MTEQTRTPTSRLLALVLALVVALVALPAAPATAATTAGWASWDPLVGSAGDYSTTMQLPAGGFPAASVTSDSRSGQVGVQTGSSTWLSAATPPGEIFGSSRDLPYLNLRPRADNPGAPSTTTYTFERPAPPGSWAFVLGDIDADRAIVTARGPDGSLLTATEMGWQGGFNYCTPAGNPSCTGDVDDVATWDPDTGELIGNAAAVDTAGASGWFMPTAPVASLTIEFFQRNGLPIYQTWFASLARDISGSVNHAEDGPLAGATMTLTDSGGAVVATTTSDADGGYAFTGFAATAGYTVEVVPPDAPAGSTGYIVEGPQRLPADLSETDATALDFLVRDIVPVAVSGRVTADGDPVPGATVILVDAEGAERSAVSDSTGFYVLDGVQPGDYTFDVEPPDGYGVVSIPGPLSVPTGTEDPIVDQDVVLQQAPSLSGTVTAGGAPVPGAAVTITGPGGTASTVTGADGGYVFDLLPSGEHTVSIEIPEGYVADGPTEQVVTVGTEDVVDVDFTLQRLGSIGGVVADGDGDPVPDVTVVVSGPDGDVTVVTDAAGRYLVSDLVAGDYVIELEVPEGYEAEITQRATSITAAGESRLEEDFVVVALPVPPVEVGGTVTTTDGEALEGVVVTILDGEGDGAVVATATTGPDGSWSTTVPPGTYVAEVAAPAGYEVEGDAQLAFEAGEDAVLDLDFVLRLVEEPTTPGVTPPPSQDPAPGPGPGEPMPSTGTDPAPAAALAVLLLLGGVALVAAARAGAARRTG